MNFKNWRLENGELDEEELTLHYEGELNGKKYDGYIVDLHEYDDILNSPFQTFNIEEYNDEILTKIINIIINKPRFNELPAFLQDMYKNHSHSQVYMIYYGVDSYEEDMEEFTHQDIDEANAFIDKHFDDGCGEYFVYPEEVSEEWDDAVTMYGSIWEQVDFTECENFYK